MRQCSVDGCHAPLFARAWCGAHYKRWYRHGNPLGGRAGYGEGGGYVATHEWVNRHFPRLGRCECCARVGKTEYANISHAYRRTRDDWFELCTRCHRAFDGHPGSHASGAKQRAKTHCPRGHRYDPENTYLIKTGGRQCRTCGRERDQARRTVLV